MKITAMCIAIETSSKLCAFGDCDRQEKQMEAFIFMN